MHNLPRLPCYLNGEYTVLPEAKVSVMDRGFIFGDGVYEAIPVYAGQPFRFAHHMARLERSLQETRIPQPHSTAQWQEIALNLIAAYAYSTGDSTQNTDQFVYLQVTRGVAMRDHVMPQGITPTVFAMTNAMKPPTAQQRADGVACVTAEDFRWEKAHIKSTSLLGAVMARQTSFDAGAVETVMFRRGFLSEAAASNVWVIKHGVVMGPPKDHLVLEGIRYGLIEEICQAADIPFVLRRLQKAKCWTPTNCCCPRPPRKCCPSPLWTACRLEMAGPAPSTRLCTKATSASRRNLPPLPPTNQRAPVSLPEIPPSESLITYPSQFPIKIMGARAEGFVHAITTIAHAFDPAFDASTIELRESKGGKYLGVTITITATSREQLDELYRTLSTHPMVKVVL